MSYYHDLAFQLRLRQLPERDVARVLEDVRELSVTTGTGPDVEFGPARAYAARFPQGRRRRTDLGTCLFIACVLTALALGVVNAAADLRGTARLLSPGSSLVAYAVLFVAGATTAIVYLHRLPREFRQQARGEGDRRPTAAEDLRE